MAHTSGLPDHTAAFEELYEEQNSYLTPEDILDAYMEALEEEALFFGPGSNF